MTIASETTKHVYNGDGTTTEWPYTFQLLGTDTSTIHVYLCSPTGTITETAQFTVDTDNLKVKYPSVASELSPLASGWKIVLLRHEPVTQTLDLENQGTFNAEAIEAELDKLTMICQQLGEVLGRTVQFTLVDSGSDLSSVKFLSDCKAAQDAAEASASAASSSASSASSSASSASTSAGTATTKAAEAAASAAEAAEILSSVDVHLTSNQTFTGTNTFTKQIQASGGIMASETGGSTPGARIIEANADGIGFGGELRLDQNLSTNLKLSGLNVPFVSFKSANGQLQFQNMSTGSTVAYISTGGIIRSLAGFIGATYFLLMNSGYTQLAQLLADGTNTFLDFTGSLKFRAGVGGTEKASIDASGNVAASGNLTISGTGDSSVAGKLGIGTTSPSKALHIHSTSADNHLKLSSVAPGVFLSNAEGAPTSYGVYAMATSDGGGHYGLPTAGDNLLAANHNIYITANYQTSGKHLILQPLSGPSSAGGKVGIGTASPAYNLDVYGAAASARVNGNDSASHLYMAKSGTNYAHLAVDGTDTYFDYGGSTGRLFFRAGVEGTTKVTFGSAGEVSAASLAGTGNRAVYSDSAGQLTNSSSDARLKKDVVSISSAAALSQISQLRPVTFHWDTSVDRAKGLGTQQEIGLIAQEVESIVPQVVGENSDGFKSLDYAKLVPVLIGAVQAQQAEIAALKKRIEILEAK